MGPYGLVSAPNKTGRSPMAQDYFWTPPDPKIYYKNEKMIRETQHTQNTCVFCVCLRFTLIKQSNNTGKAVNEKRRHHAEATMDMRMATEILQPFPQTK